MESPKDNNNVPENAFPPFVSGDTADFPPGVEWSDEFDCPIINGVLAPMPISFVPPSAADHDKHDLGPSQGEPRRTRQKPEGLKEIFFKLFKMENAHEQYVLETHEMNIGATNRHQVIVYESSGRWKVRMHELSTGDHVVVPLMEDPNPPFFYKKYELSLQERLIGWSLERRRRGNGREDKFYYHHGRQFRSFLEVATFIVYSCKMKDLPTIAAGGTTSGGTSAGATTTGDTIVEATSSYGISDERT